MSPAVPMTEHTSVSSLTWSTSDTPFGYFSALCEVRPIRWRHCYVRPHPYQCHRSGSGNPAEACYFAHGFTMSPLPNPRVDAGALRLARFGSGRLGANRAGFGCSCRNGWLDADSAATAGAGVVASGPPVASATTALASGRTGMRGSAETAAEVDAVAGRACSVTLGDGRSNA